MNSAPWFPFYVADWLDSETVFGMTLEEEGAYIRLLALMWRKGGSVPDNDQWVSNGLRCKPAKWRKIRSVFLEKNAIFERDGSLFNKKLSENLQECEERAGKARESAKTRWGKYRKKTNKNNETEDADALQSQCYNSTVQYITVQENNIDHEFEIEKQKKLVEKARTLHSGNIGEPSEAITLRLLNVAEDKLKEMLDAT